MWALVAVSKSTLDVRRAAAASIISAAKRGLGTEVTKSFMDPFQKLTDQLVKLCFWQPANPREFKNSISAGKEFVKLMQLLPNCSEVCGLIGCGCGWGEDGAGLVWRVMTGGESGWQGECASMSFPPALLRCTLTP